MTQEEMAEKLGVARRTVAAWHEKPDIVIKPELQRALDTTYDLAPKAVKIRFARMLRDQDGSATAAGLSDDGGIALTVAIAVVVTGNDVLIVCRRDEDPGGITWQFPAGVVKPGARAATVAMRETLAETGVHCSVQAHLGSRVHPLSHVYCEYFLCEYLGGTVENRDASENVSAIWVSRADVARFIPRDRIFRPVLDALEDLHDTSH